MTEHTPGGWKAEPADMFGDHNITLANDAGDCRAIAAVVANLRPETEVAANARLIAASPTMAAYIQRKADEGDVVATAIMEAIHASS